MINKDPCCCKWGCDCRLEEGKCRVCNAKEIREILKKFSNLGWHVLAGTGNEKILCQPEDSDFKNPLTISEALKIII